MRGIYLQLKQFCIVQEYFTLKNECRCLSRVQFSFFFDISFKISQFFLFKKKFSVKNITLFPLLWTVLRTFTSGPSGRAGRL